MRGMKHRAIDSHARRRSCRGPWVSNLRQEFGFTELFMAFPRLSMQTVIYDVIFTQDVVFSDSYLLIMLPFDAISLAIDC